MWVLIKMDGFDVGVFDCWVCEVHMPKEVNKPDREIKP